MTNVLYGDGSTPPVHCLHCGTLQDWEKSLWGFGPAMMRVDFTCPNCGWLVQAKAQTLEFMMSQMRQS